MSFEAEVIPLFIGGVIAVSAIEFFLGWRSLRHRKDLRGCLPGTWLPCCWDFSS
mgnify:CR=1 FL=1